jgi:hypothetical protein
MNALGEAVFWFLNGLEEDDTPDAILAVAKKLARFRSQATPVISRPVGLLGT